MDTFGDFYVVSAGAIGYSMMGIFLLWVGASMLIEAVRFLTDGRVLFAKIHAYTAWGMSTQGHDRLEWLMWLIMAAVIFWPIVVAIGMLTVLMHTGRTLIRTLFPVG